MNDASHPNWNAITASAFPWEKEALDYIRAQFPGHEPYRAWSNFEFIADDGSLNEVDLLVFTPMGFFLIEIKSRPGVLTGDAHTWTWQHDGHSKVVDNPIFLANTKAKKLASLLQRQRAFDKLRVPFIDPLIFCPAENLQCQLQGNARFHICLRDQANRPGIMAVWWPRFLAVADWFLETENARRASGWYPLAVETKGRLILSALSGDITLVAKADRIDIRASDRALAILDYKTGTPPSAAQIEDASAPQLPLEAAMIAGNAFPDIAPAPVTELAHMKLSGTQPPGQYYSWPKLEGQKASNDPVADITKIATLARENMLALANLFDDERTSYGAAFSGDGDYAHLARFGEWSTPAAESGEDT